MTNPTLWGPALWQALFACAWHCPPQAFDALFDLLMRQVPLLLPCQLCRRHFGERRAQVTRRAGGEPTKPLEAFVWLWHLKDQVNRSLGQRSTSLADVTERHAAFGAPVDDVALGDALEEERAEEDAKEDARNRHHEQQDERHEAREERAEGAHLLASRELRRQEEAAGAAGRCRRRSRSRRRTDFKLLIIFITGHIIFCCIQIMFYLFLGSKTNFY